MAKTTCPECGARVREEEMERHLRRAHPERDATERRRTWWMLPLALVVVAVLVGTFLFWPRAEATCVAIAEAPTLRDVAASPTETSSTVFVATGAGLYRLQDGALCRVGEDRAPLTALAADANVPHVLYAGAKNAGRPDVRTSIDGGLTWTVLDAYGGGSVAAVATAPSDIHVVYAADGSALYRTDTKGEAWTAATGTALSGSISALAVHGQVLSTLYAAASTGLLSSGNGGESWFALANPTGSLTALAVDPRNANRQYAYSTAEGFVRTANGGETWETAAIGALSGPVIGLAVDPRDSSRLVAITSNQMFESADYGASWTPLG